MDARPAAAPHGLTITTGELAAILGAELAGPSDLRLDRVDTIEHAGPTTLTFVRDARHAARFLASGAGAALVARAAAQGISPGPSRAVLVVDDPDLALIALLSKIAPPPSRPSGISPHARVDPTARLAESVSLGPGAAVGPGSAIGPNTILHANVTVGAGVTLGTACELHPGVVIQDRCTLADRVVIHPNAVIGADGFGYRPDPAGRGLVKIPHAGNVVIESDVEIGAGTTIDRGKFGPTLIGAGTKIDNLVQIGHNCRIGRACIICGCSALAGSVTLGDGVTLAGGVGIADGRTVGSRATVGARSGLMDDVPPGETWVGYPARPARQSMRLYSALDKLPDLIRAFNRGSE
ncbi:MAG: UDP-3-O-(3-hydroxymyristoyl)glucosamine N-acyltransferase [Phycisphaerales bacterium]|nr:UDP-3-O-(3-hydroxymyristoyl)glucosamine N-acyltransferase [Phycisphaerales bacterium]